MPKLIEINASASTGGKVQVKDFKVNLDYHYSNSEKWDVSDLSTEEAEAFRVERIRAIKSSIEVISDEEFQALMAYAAELND